MIPDIVVRVVALAAIAVIVVALILEKPAPTKEMLTVMSRINEEANKLVGRKVVLVEAMPRKADRNPSTVYLVHAKNVLQANPILPWEGLPVQQVVKEFQRKFGAKNVVTDTQIRKRSDKVTVVHDPRTMVTKRVVVPRRWSMPAPRARVMSSKRRVGVAINPTTNVFLKSTLVLVTDKNGIVTSASIK